MVFSEYVFIYKRIKPKKKKMKKKPVYSSLQQFLAISVPRLLPRQFKSES